MMFKGFKLSCRRDVGAAALMLAMASIAHAGHTNTVLTTDLWGGEEVNNDAADNRIAGDPNGRGEAYVFGIDGDPLTLCYVLTVDKIQTVPVAEGMAAHIHFGQRGENGPPIAFLAGPEDGNAADCLTEGEPGKFEGPAGIVQTILENPEDYYINVHNLEYPGGAIRGQLRYQDPHDH
ncbi:CHRD domain-containing protein [Pontibacter sp. JAM-7]|uniref:CHRD domain-containing protein n=1 Tax=Pontibacter sp. JAM-7 TaxID=3366581 RepID=UPI003AF75D5D